MLGVGDGKMRHPPIAQPRCQIIQIAVRLQRRSGGNHQRNPADAIQNALIRCEPVLCQIQDKFLICGHKHLKRRALADLAGKISG